MSKVSDSTSAETTSESRPANGNWDRIRKKPTAQSPLRRNAIIAGLLAILVAFMLWDTQFLTAEEVDALTPDEFDPAETAEELFAEAQNELAQDGHDLGAVAEALNDSPEAAAEEFDPFVPSEGTEVYAVSATGTVEEATEDNLTLDADGVPAEQSVVLPLGNAVDGDLIRDISGFSFGDAPGQTEYQQVGNELSALLRAYVQEELGGDVSALEGETITVNGMLRYVATDSEAAGERPLIIQALYVEVGL